MSRRFYSIFVPFLHSEPFELSRHSATPAAAATADVDEDDEDDGEEGDLSEYEEPITPPSMAAASHPTVANSSGQGR